MVDNQWWINKYCKSQIFSKDLKNKKNKMSVLDNLLCMYDFIIIRMW